MGAQYTVLFTPNLTQKRKKWFDGKLKFDSYHRKLKLYDENGCPVAQKSCNASDSLPEVGDTVQFARFIVEIDSIDYVENKTDPSSASTAPLAKPPPLQNPVTPQKRPTRQVPLKRPMGLPLNVLLKDPKLRLQPSQAPKRNRELPEFPIRDTHPGPYPTSNVDSGPYPVSNDPEITTNEPLFVPDLPSSPDIPFQPPPEAQEAPLEAPRQAPLEAPLDPQVEEPIDLVNSEDELIDLTIDDSIVPPDSYDLPSDLESDVELVEVANKPRRSLFENMPSNLSSTGPWTKEAYLLFSWHPPVVKEEI